MKTTRIHIKNLFGIKETELDGRSIEITGSNGVGKTSIIDSIKYALTKELQACLKELNGVFKEIKKLKSVTTSEQAQPRV